MLSCPSDQVLSAQWCLPDYFSSSIHPVSPGIPELSGSKKKVQFKPWAFHQTRGHCHVSGLTLNFDTLKRHLQPKGPRASNSKWQSQPMGLFISSFYKKSKRDPSGDLRFHNLSVTCKADGEALSWSWTENVPRRQRQWKAEWEMRTESRSPIDHLYIE